MSTSMFEGFIIVTNRRLCEGDFLEKIDALAKTQARAIILREKDLSAVEYRSLAEKVLAICRAHGKPCILHSHVKIAEELGAAGVHLPMPLLLEAEHLKACPAQLPQNKKSGLDKSSPCGVRKLHSTRRGSIHRTRYDRRPCAPRQKLRTGCMPGAAAPGPLLPRKLGTLPIGEGINMRAPSLLGYEGVGGTPMLAERSEVGRGLPAGKNRIALLQHPSMLALVNSMTSTKFALGASVHSVEEARAAERAGASYLLAGHIFATDCKRGLPGRGLGFLAEVCRAVSIPVYGLGGLSEAHLPALIAAGAKGGAVMSAAMRATFS